MTIVPQQRTPFQAPDAAFTENNVACCAILPWRSIPASVFDPEMHAVPCYFLHLNAVFVYKGRKICYYIYSIVYYVYNIGEERISALILYWK